MTFTTTATRVAAVGLCACTWPLHLTAAEGDDPLWAKPLGGDAELQLVDVSAITQVAVGGSSGDAHQLEATQSGAHDPNRDGFTFQQLELSITGAVDPYFRAEAHMLVTSDHGLELEEAFAVTTGLPHGLEVEAGYMLTEFGRYNPVHTHEYAHIDQPLVIGYLLGSEGMRDVGARVGWLLPTNWYSHLDLTVQNGDDGTMASFLGEGHDHGGDDHDHEEEGFRNIDSVDEVVYTGRWTNGSALGDDLEMLLGVSASYGPNLEDDHTLLLGADLTLKWYNPAAVGSAGTLRWTTEVISRDYGHHDGESVTDFGLVSTAVYDLAPQWRVGLRLDLIDLDEHEEEDGHDDEEHEAGDVFRVSPLVAYMPSEFTKFRLQYNYSDIEDDEDVHSVWLGLEVLIGAHPAHAF